jgi:DNA-binding FadR family transcriptional regulator
MEPVARNVSLSAQIVDQLRERIANGEYPVGSRLPTELELSRIFGVSRNSVREATRSLVYSGLLVARAGDGTYVQRTSELAHALYRRTERSRADDVAELRELLERTAARHAAVRANEAEIQIMRDALVARDAAEDSAAYITNDLRFHRAIADGSGNALLAEIYRGLDDIEAHLSLVTPSGAGFRVYIEETRELNEEHDQLLAAIERHDADRAEEIAGALVTRAHSLRPAQQPNPREAHSALGAAL